MPDSKMQIFEVTIASSETESTILNKSNFSIMGFEVPASMTSTALTFEVGSDSSSMTPLRKDDNTAVSYTIDNTAGAYYMPAQYTAGYPYFRIVAGSSEGGSRTIKVYGYKA